MPCLVPIASPGESASCSPSGAMPTTFSPASSGTSSLAAIPPLSDTVPACSGNTGNGSTSVLNARPLVVITRI